MADAHFHLLRARSSTMSATTFAVSASPAACRGSRTAASASFAARRATLLRAPAPSAALAASQKVGLRACRKNTHRRGIARASDGEAAEAVAPATAAAAAVTEPPPADFSKICALEDLPRGDRKKVTALGKAVLLFWYKVRLATFLPRQTPNSRKHWEGLRLPRFDA